MYMNCSNLADSMFWSPPFWRGHRNLPSPVGTLCCSHSSSAIFCLVMSNNALVTSLLNYSKSDLHLHEYVWRNLLECSGTKPHTAQARSMWLCLAINNTPDLTVQPPGARLSPYLNWELQQGLVISSTYYTVPMTMDHTRLPTTIFQILR